jgi:hypothetical protein
MKRRSGSDTVEAPASLITWLPADPVLVATLER